MLITPRQRNLPQCSITIPIPYLRKPVRAHPVFEPSECPAPPYGLAQIVAYGIIYRITEPLHDTVFVDVKPGRQGEIVIRCQNCPSETKSVTLPVRKVFKGVLFLSRSSLFI